MSSSDIYREEPNIYTFAELTTLSHLASGRDLTLIPRTADGRLKIDAIFVFSSPRDWGLDLQLILDLLLSHNGILGTSSPKNGIIRSQKAVKGGFIANVVESGLNLKGGIVLCTGCSDQCTRLTYATKPKGVVYNLVACPLQL